MMKKRNVIIASILIFSLVVGVYAYQFMFPKQEYAVSTSDPLATKVGMDVLKNGGTAVDAAIAISYTLGVVEPYASGIGGGGGMLIDRADASPTFIDYREVAPNDDKGEEVGVPGFVAGMDYIHHKYGTLPMNELIDPAIGYAEKGFTVDQDLHDHLISYSGNIDEQELKSFYSNGKAIDTGDTLKQSELADTLQTIKEEGPNAFYKGEIADEIQGETEISVRDLREYKPVERKPLMTTYKGHEIISAPPPFSGATLIQMLKMADKEDVLSLKEKHPSLFYHYLSEISKVAYQDRLKKMADPSFIKQASDDWVDDHYVNLLIKQINETQANKTKVSDVEEHESTTHFVVIDGDGTVVSTTNTLSNFFGSGKYVDGFFLNNTLSTFGEGINKIEEGKRPRTFTAPTIIREGDEWIMAIGTPGGNRIPQVLMQVMGNYFENNQSIKKSIESKRVIFESHKFYSEAELNEQTKDQLKTYGYDLETNDNPMFYGGVQALVKDLKKNRIKGDADLRRHGSWEKDTK
ncbi:gamma-glutamyltransferase family protein [Peribacillus sp. YIM B13482]|uniref:gamma-glutamyltransferase family protein n=1 Tax=Peribacillus sp. YIM B13482 TaxID=3366298 RepID=UPI00366FE6AD